MPDPFVTYSSFQTIPGDFNGDGKIETLYQIRTIIPKINSFHSDEKKHFTHKITDGHNQQIGFYHVPLTNNVIYEKGSGSSYPLMDFQEPLYVVSRQDVPNGIGGVSQTFYSYKGAKIHRQGKGFLGFAQVTASNLTTNRKNTNKYEIDETYYFPMLKESLLETIGGSNISKTTNPPGHYTTHNYESVYGNVISETDIAGHETTYQYNNGFGQLTQTNTPEGHTITSTTDFVISGSPERALYYSNIQAPGVPDSKVYYDEFGREIRSETDGPDGLIIVENEFNNKGQVLKTSQAYYYYFIHR